MYPPVVVPEELPECLAAQGWTRPRPSRVGATVGWWYRDSPVPDARMNRHILTYNYNGQREWEIEFRSVDGNMYVHTCTHQDPEVVALWYITGLLTGDWED